MGKELENLFKVGLFPNYLGFNEDFIEKMSEMFNAGKNAEIVANMHNERFSVDTDRLTIDIVVPGLTKEDIKVIVNKKEMTVTISTTFKEKEDGDFWFVTPFEKTYKLPEGIDFGSFKKVCENGVLTVMADINPEQDEKEYLLTF